MTLTDPFVLCALQRAALELRKVRPDRMVVMGICGAQGSGKSTLASELAAVLASDGLRCAILSLDDLYLTREDRGALARDIHPLLATRGPPGTHDVTRGLEIVDRLRNGDACWLPRFDKASDDLLPESEWEYVPAGCDVLILEGWCVGARPQSAKALGSPVNALEALEDRDGIWRRFTNAALADTYQELFRRIDHLTFLKAPAFDVILDWRWQQEDEMRRRISAGGASRAMNRDQIARFISHYERITQQLLEEMPARADVTASLGRDRHIQSLNVRRPSDRT